MLHAMRYMKNMRTPKFFLIFILLLAFVVVTGCTQLLRQPINRQNGFNLFPPLTTNQPVKGEESQENAEEIASDFVMNMAQYKDNNGRNLQIVQTVPVICSGCWIIDIWFDVDSLNDPSVTERAIIQVTIDNWEVVSMDYRQEPIDQASEPGQDETADTESASEKMTLEEAITIAEKSDCVKEGALTDVTMYNDFTKTWWINLEIDKPGCLPACVISEETQTAEINWRCTGLIIPQE